MPPIRSPRRIYKIEQIKVNKDDNPDGVDQAPGETVNGTSVFIYAKIKEGVGKFLGLEPLPYDAPEFRGVFKGDGLNKGSIYRRRIGGFKVASYKLLPYGLFNIEESFYGKSDGLPKTETNQFKSISIGLPTGHSVWEVIYWLGQIGKIPEIRAVVTPSGVKHDLYTAPA